MVKHLKLIRNLSKFYPNATQRTAANNNLNIVKEEINIVKSTYKIEIHEFLVKRC
jgi:hypothetical protein